MTEETAKVSIGVDADEASDDLWRLISDFSDALTG